MIAYNNKKMATKISTIVFIFKAQLELKVCEISQQTSRATKKKSYTNAFVNKVK